MHIIIWSVMTNSLLWLMITNVSKTFNYRYRHSCVNDINECVSWFFWPLCLQWKLLTQHWHIFSYMLTNSCPLTHPANMEQYWQIYILLIWSLVTSWLYVAYNIHSVFTSLLLKLVCLLFSLIDRSLMMVCESFVMAVGGKTKTIS